MTLVYLTLGWASGILLSHLLRGLGWIGCSMPVWPFAAPMTLASGCLVALRRYPKRRLAAAVLLFIIAGAWRYHAHPLNPCSGPGDLAYYNGEDDQLTPRTIEGFIVGFPDLRDTRVQYRLRAEHLIIGNEAHRVRGDVVFQVSRYPTYAYGDRLRVTGSLQVPPVLDDFDYRSYLAARGVRSVLRRANAELIGSGGGHALLRTLNIVRARSATALERILPEPAAALASGMLLGIESGIPAELDEAFRLTGTAHIIVISGSNIAMLSGMLMAALGRFLGRRRAVLPTVLLLAAYVLLIGADASALRAGLMGVLYVVAILFGRQSTHFVSLCASGFLMTLADPLALWDLSFQLSFAATLGLILFTPAIAVRLERLLTGCLPQAGARPLVGLLKDTVAVTLAAQVTLLPLLIYHFGQLSLLSLVSNFLVLPVQPPILVGGMAALAGGLVWEPLGRVLAAIPWLFLEYTTAVVQGIAALPFAALEVGDAARPLAILYVLLLSAFLVGRKLRRIHWLPMPARRVTACLAAAGMLLCAGWITWRALPDRQLHVTFVQGDEGEAVLIITPSGRRVWMWDGRGNGPALAAAVRPLLPGWSRTVTLGIGPSGSSLWPGATEIDAAEVAPGATLVLDRDVTLSRLATTTGWAWLLTYDRLRTILPAALAPEDQAAFMADSNAAGFPLTLIKLPAAQAGPSPSAEFLHAASPQIILCPDEALLASDMGRFSDASSIAWLSPQAVAEVVSDGAKLWLQQWNAGSIRRW